MGHIALVTDSTSNIPPDIAAKRRIHVAPLYILWGDESYKDGIDLTDIVLFQRMQETTLLPKTSQVSVPDFVAVFEAAQHNEGAEAIVCPVISEELSGTYASAIQAAEQVDIPVHVIDTRQTSWGLGFAVLAAADARDNGASVEEIVHTIKQAAANSQVIFTVDTLDYLHRGGRIGKASWLVGSALSIKPLLVLQDGVIHAVDKVRTHKRAVEHLLKVADHHIKGRQVKRLCIIHSGPEDEARGLLTDAKARFSPGETYLTYVAAVIGVHIGPGALGIIVEWDS